MEDHTVDDLQNSEGECCMIEWIKTLLDYNYWGHHKLWACIIRLSKADFRAENTYSWGSVQVQVVHVMWAEAVWYARIHGLARPEFTAADFPDRRAIRAKLDQIEADWRAYATQITQAELERTFEVQRLNGERYTHSALEVIPHMVNHGTDHRAQILQRIHTLDGQTFAQDMIYYLRERNS
jgi:uncharacterized damage-inducible protein DinB